MRIIRGHDVAGILVGTGNLLVTDDDDLLAHVRELENRGRLSVQEAINHMNAGGYTVRGAYQLAEAPSDREREMQLFHTAHHHDLNITIDLLENSKPVEARRDDAVIGELVKAAARTQAEKEQLEETVRVLRAAAAKLEQDLEAAKTPSTTTNTLPQAARVQSTNGNCP